MPRRGEIYYADLRGTKGREQRAQRRRPVLIVSADAINAQPLVLTVVVGTDAANVSRRYSSNVSVSAGESGLPSDTVFLCFQIRSLDESRLERDGAGNLIPAGVMPPAKMAEVENALRLVLAL
jgi:mRNA interferase MazF